jgi:redox-sensitive bicupin YhaK (pirin superfamily)
MNTITLQKRPADERGHTDISWLDSWHTFSFGDYVDREHHAFRVLRVINDDRVLPGHGFPEHPHRDMEILTYVIAGELTHRDSMGHTRTVGAGQVQYMSAGTGVTHSEFNASATVPVHLLQIWIIPRARG